MAKGSTSEKSNKSANFHQFHPPNESFVKRVTNRVSELLPQPTTWLSKWLSTSQQSQEEKEEEALRPPSKKRRLSPTANDYAHQNNILQYEANSGEISPITHGRIPDMAIAGPSGLHNPTSGHFISSTPAVPSPKHSPQLTSKANGDDGSDSSDSTSGCSSLVPQADKPSNFSTKRIRLTSEETNTSPGSSMSGRNLKRFFPQRKSTRMDESLYSSRAAPTFDLFTFQNSYRGGLPNRSLRDEATLSPFYKGRTMYGGASSRCQESLEKSFESVSRRPTQVFNVKPASQRSTETMGSTARKILDVLEKFSTPVLEAKKIPLKPNTRNTKRKLPQPYEELCIPQLPDLLRIKRREKELAVIESPKKKEETLQPKPSSVETEKKEETPVPKISGKTSVIGFSPNFEKAAVVEKTPSAPLFPPVQIPNLKTTQKPLPSTPSFSFVPKSKPNPPQTKADPAPTFSFALSKPVEAPTSSFKFSSPITLSTNASMEPAPVSTTFSFSAPLEATEDKPEVKPEKEEPAKPVFNFNSSPSLIKLKRKDPVKMVEDDKPLVTSSVTDYFKAKKIEEKSEKKDSDLKEFKLNSDQWECKECYVKNSKDKDTCAACQSPKEDKPKVEAPPKPLGQLFKNPQGTWECKECFVVNKSNDSVCVACSTPKSGKETKPLVATPSLGAAFKKPEGSWECDVCMVQNKPDVSECVACNSLKPGAKPKAPEAKFTFGIPASDNKASFFTLEPKQDKPTFSFGMPQTEAPKVGSSGIFNFGNNLKKDEEVKSPPKNGGFTFNPPKQEEGKKPEEQTEKAPVFTFGLTKKVETDKPSFFQTGPDPPMFKFGSEDKKEPPKLFEFKSHKKDNPPNTLEPVISTPEQPINNTEEKPAFEATQKPVFSPPEKPLFEPSNDWRPKPFSEPNPFSSPTSAFSFRANESQPTPPQPTFNFNAPPQTNSVFTFKAADQPSESKPVFQFNAAGSQPNSTFQSGMFGAPAQPAPVFGAQAPAAPTFNFGATSLEPAQQPGAPVFTFNAQSAVGSSVTPFTFGSQNSTIGSTPGFTPPAPMFAPSVNAGEKQQQRKIKKAIRRTTNLH